MVILSMSLIDQGEVLKKKVVSNACEELRGSFLMVVHFQRTEITRFTLEGYGMVGMGKRKEELLMK